MQVLVLNCGSSSVRMSRIETEDGRWAARGRVERIGEAPEGEAPARVERAGEPVENLFAPSRHAEAVRWLADRVLGGARPRALGHRVVHGGEWYAAPIVVTPEVLRDLEQLSPLAPLHNPPNLEGIRLGTALYPDLPQVAVFDTAFHATLPPAAYRYALPESLYREAGIRRYGFHGTSHQYVTERAAAMLGNPQARLVSLHLGNGCSAAAVRGGRCLDTSMGMTPLEGLVMGTRSGDLDPSVPLLLQRRLGLGPEAVDRLLNHESGLEALSGGMSDMRDIERARAAGDERAALAFDVFCHRARKYVGAYAAVLGGLDALVFTAGIGENSAAVRAGICAGLEHLGLRLDSARNGQNPMGARDVAAADSRARILVVPTDEELVIARETEKLLLQGKSHAPGPV